MANQIAVTQTLAIEKMYRDFGIHNECKEAIYLKGDEHITNQYPDFNDFLDDHPAGHPTNPYIQDDEQQCNIGCDTCI